jgi:CheY-like chemotaxis protein/glycine cleavage system H lipoate-binding protein
MADGARILVVDDELPVCKSVSSALSTEDYSVDMALSAEEALTKEQEETYDVIITDLMMPGLSGMDLLRKLKEKRSDVRIIMITGYPSIKSAVESIKIGAFDYIPKPFTPNDLRSLVARALASKHYHEKREALREGAVAAPEVAVPEGLYCIPENSWARLEDAGAVRIGIHHMFLKTIKKISSMELPQPNEMRYQGEACVRLTDSNDHVHKIWTPVSGRIAEINEAVQSRHSRVFEDPYGDGWILLLKSTNLDSELQNLIQV